MKARKLTCAVLAIVVMAAVSVTAGGPPSGTIWADGTAYRTVGTPTELPDRGPKDGIYVFDNLMGQNPVSESKPGDRDYNGGRWQVYVLVFTDAGLDIHDPDGDGHANFELTSWEEVENHISLGHLERAGMGPSFVCPLIRK